MVETALSRSQIDTRAIWPRLDTISAWTDGASRLYARHLRELFPHAYLQPKGLLATEGAVTIHWAGLAHPVPALMSSVIEFIDDADQPHLCDELLEGIAYRIVITTPGGLYRYDLGDRVRCSGIAAGLPQLEFIGRAELVSDLIGEKLTEEFVCEVLGALDVPACLVPRPEATPFYELLVQAEPGVVVSMGNRIEKRLCDNPQYAYARAIGQLGPLRPRGVTELLDRMMTAQAQRGRRLADIKPPALIFDQHLREF
jgi:hypothetical protein